MSKLEFKASWSDIRTRLKKQFNYLTDDDLLYEKGDEENLIGRLQKKTGRSRDDLVEMINNF